MARVTIKTRKVLLAHSNGDITTHYSQVEILELIEAVNRVCTGNIRKMATLTIPKTKLDSGRLPEWWRPWITRTNKVS